MIKLNEMQRKILACVDEVYPRNLSSEKLSELGIKPDLKDIKLLQELNLVAVTYFASVGNIFEGHLKITPQGKEKLQETFITRIYDTAYNNPWVVIAVIVSLISIGSNWYVSHTTEKVQVDLNEVKGKIAQFDTLVVKNITSSATSDKISIQCPNGTRWENMSFDAEGAAINCVKI